MAIVLSISTNTALRTISLSEFFVIARRFVKVLVFVDVSRGIFHCLTTALSASTTDICSDEPIRFYERTSPGSRIISACFSPGGSLFVIGDTHRFLGIYSVTERDIIKIKDIEAHSVCTSFSILIKQI